MAIEPMGMLSRLTRKLLAQFALTKPVSMALAEQALSDLLGVCGGVSQPKAKRGPRRSARRRSCAWSGQVYITREKRCWLTELR